MLTRINISAYNTVSKCVFLVFRLFNQSNYLALTLAFLFTAVFTIQGQQKIEGKITENISSSGYSYLFHHPSEITAPKPLIIFLHGSGEKGNNLELVKIHGPFKFLKDNYLDAYVLAPQCPLDEYWENGKLNSLVDKIITENNIDTNRIHLTGLSMGAWGAWNFAVYRPELLASLVPIAGFVDRIPMIEACDLVNIPVRIYHGLLDQVVNVYYSIEMFKRLKACSDKVQLTVVEDAGHDCWTDIYDNNEIYIWMLRQTKMEVNKY
jgi:predicted peptidase